MNRIIIKPVLTDVLSKPALIIADCACECES